MISYENNSPKRIPLLGPFPSHLSLPSKLNVTSLPPLISCYKYIEPKSASGHFL